MEDIRVFVLKHNAKGIMIALKEEK